MCFHTVRAFYVCSRYWHRCEIGGQCVFTLFVLSMSVGDIGTGENGGQCVFTLFVLCMSVGNMGTGVGCGKHVCCAGVEHMCAKGVREV